MGTDRSMAEVHNDLRHALATHVVSLVSSEQLTQVRASTIGGQTYCFEIDPSATTLAAKLLLESLMSLPADQQRLLLENTLLADSDMPFVGHQHVDLQLVGQTEVLPYGKPHDECRCGGCGSFVGSLCDNVPGDFVDKSQRPAFLLRKMVNVDLRNGKWDVLYAGAHGPMPNACMWKDIHCHGCDKLLGIQMAELKPEVPPKFGLTLGFFLNSWHNFGNQCVP